MKQKHLVVALGAAMSLALATSASANGPDPDRYIVTIKPGSAANVENAARAAGGRVHLRITGTDAIALSVPEQALQGLRNNPNVLSIEPDAVRFPMGQVSPYGIAKVQAPQAVAAGADGTDIKVCVIDSGIKADHEDFAGIAMTGYASGSQTWNTDTCGHGTHVAGTIAAANNNVGVVGVSPGRVSLHIIKVFDGASCGWSYASSLSDAANRCAQAGAKVINMSLGGSTSSTTENNTFSNLYSQGILSVAAAGNAGNTTMSYPASYSSVMSVAATDSNNALASFSQRNSQVEIAAPGVSVLSTYPSRDGAVTVDSLGYIVSRLEGAPQASASGGLVDGGRCTSIGAWTGRTVLCERGDISFGDKVKNAQSGGAAAVILYNNAPGGFSGTLGSGTWTVPAVSMSQEDGQFLRAGKLGSTAAVSSLTESNANGYAYLDGTSMASPHVAGVAALVWSANPAASNQQVRDALTSTAIDLGTAGRDTSFGWGLVQALSAVDALLSGGGGSTPPTTAPSNLSGTKRRQGNNYTYSLQWTGGASTVDIYRGTTRIRSSVSNSGSYSETLSRVTTATYRVCNAGSTTACSNSLTL